MKDSTKHTIEGTAHEIKGAVKQKTGHAIGNRRLEAEGAGEKGGGGAEKKLARTEKAAHITSRKEY